MVKAGTVWRWQWAVGALFACGLALAVGLPVTSGAADTYAAAAGAGAAGAAGTGPDPAASSAASHAAGRFVWQDLVTNDVNACRNFYGALFGWEFTETTRNGRPYLVARAQGRLVGGIIQREDSTGLKAAWLSFLAVDDLEKAVSTTTAAGGKVLRAPVSIKGLGRFAAVSDPQGAPLGLARLDREPPADTVGGAEGQFFWREYFARDASSALSFYRQLNGYDDKPAERSKLEYHLLERAGPQAGLLQIPDAFTNVTPNWLPYV